MVASINCHILHWIAKWDITEWAQMVQWFENFNDEVLPIACMNCDACLSAIDLQSLHLPFDIQVEECVHVY